MSARTEESASAARFFTESDTRADSFVFPLPEPWWSRPYEYAWCASFAKPDDVVLDAACGISHPFKFHLASVCKETHACDWDGRIMSDPDVYMDIIRDFGKGAAESLMRSGCLNRVRRTQASISAMPYSVRYFDTIFCISVLEHLNTSDLRAALHEFYRTLKPSGKVVLTFDYPTVNLEQFRELADQAGFEIVGGYSDTLPADAIKSDLWGRLYCYRAVLQRRLNV
ncbi:class I SAM-dependent methyltransferase [Paenibacillus sp. R14(2021)]|uniref:class I SAM-dependent methyltransferase n=1 Tax=Paenibacillus sp. R14(2021) TaxID=2859228 RepID=UPI001C614725|nr:class I SAM-dependent methyltransferase [Paenibacillus sp. R14(2021)]